jgi:hypothetical protein
MHNVIAIPATSLDSVVDSHDVWLHPKGEAGKVDGGRQRTRTPFGWAGTCRPVTYTPGDIVQQYDWSLHVREVNVSPAAVAIALTEFGFQLHYAADEQLRLAA